MRQRWHDADNEREEYLETELSVKVPFRPPQMSHEFVQVRTWDSQVRGPVITTQVKALLVGVLN
jgi:hypothetical protein